MQLYLRRKIKTPSVHKYNSIKYYFSYQCGKLTQSQEYANMFQIYTE